MSINSVQNRDLSSQDSFFKPSVAMQLGRTVVGVASIGPSIVFGVLLLVINCFGKTKFSFAANHAFRKFVTIYMDHSFAHSRHAPLPRFTDAVNLPKKEVISSGKDVKAIEQMRIRFIETHKNAGYCKKLARMKPIKGANVKGGICYGASLLMIKKCVEANISSQQQLIAQAKKFETGFDAEAVAAQEILRKTFREYLAQTRSIPETEAQYTAHIPALMGLKKADNDGKTFKITTSAADRIQFDTLSNGLYLMSLPIQYNPFGYGSRHAVAFLKYDFGSYIFDPELGLMLAKDAQAVATLSDYYNPGDPYNLISTERYTTLV